MIVLQVDHYCHACSRFSPATFYCGINTVVCCKHRKKCKRMYNKIMKEGKENDEHSCVMQEQS